MIRLDGQLKSLDQDEVTAQIQQVLSDWQAQGLNLSGVEIDHDAGNARLPAYREFLTHLRAVLPASIAAEHHRIAGVARQSRIAGVVIHSR